MRQKKLKKIIIVIKKIITAIIVMSLYILSTASLTYYHENVHQQIYDSYDIESTIEYDFLWSGGRTIAYGRCPNEQCSTLHNYNEILGYNLIAFVTSLWCILFAYKLLFNKK